MRYVGGKETLHLDGAGAGGSAVQLDGEFVVMHVCCSYDSLRTSMFPTDVVVLSAEKDLTDGLDFHHHENHHRESHHHALNSEVFNEGLMPPLSRAWLYRSGLEFDRYGSVVVNKSLLAAENIYVAGDLASYPYSTSIEANNSRNSREISSVDRHTNKSIDTADREVYKRGHDVGLINAEQTGQVAARNMSQERGRSGGKCVMPYYQAVAPYSGLNFRYFGDCSNVYASHSFWIKSASPASRIKTSDNTHSSGSVKSSNNSSMKNLFGKAGVIFYVDSSNIIRGIMLSGNDGIYATENYPIDGNRPEHYYPDKLEQVSPFCFIGKKIVMEAHALTVQDVSDKFPVKRLQSIAYTLMNPAERIVHGQANKSLESTNIPTKSQSSNTLTAFNNITSNDVNTPSSPMRYIFSRPRALNGSAVTGSKSLLNPLNVSIKGSSMTHPWRYSIQSSEISEPIFYRSSKQFT